MTPHVDYDLIVIGGGIVGLATAYKIAIKHPHLKIAVLEKEATLASHQTGHNSGVIHSGLYYRPDSAKANTCAKGRRELMAFAKSHDINYDICGKIIVATDDRELPHMNRVFENGRKNDVEGIEKISAERIRELEPACAGIAGLYVPCTGIIDFTQVAETLAGLITQQNKHNNILMEHEVTGFDRHDFYTKIITSKWPFSISTQYVICCAGLQSDRIARLDGVDAGMRIVPFRGDYFELSGTAAEKVKNLIYPVPDPRFPFLGIHFTRTIDGTVECGPNAVFAFKREGYSKTGFNFKDTKQSLQFSGTWKLFLKNWKYGMDEYLKVFSKRLFLRQVQRLIPSITIEDIKPSKCGVRAQAVARNGEPIDDFHIECSRHTIHVLNAPSPAATACLAIGEHIEQMAVKRFKLDA